jgi:hypothetical protein
VIAPTTPPHPSDQTTGEVGMDIATALALAIGATVLVVLITLVIFSGRAAKFNLGNLITLETVGSKAGEIFARTAPTDAASPEEKRYLLLREYHAQGLAQSKFSFWFSLVFASIGFAVIVYSIVSTNGDAALIPN